MDLHMCLKTIVIFFFSAQIVAGSEQPTSCRSSDNDLTLKGSALMMLHSQRTKKRIELVTDAKNGTSRTAMQVHSYGPYRAERPLYYFRSWAHGQVASILSKEIVESHLRSDGITLTQGDEAMTSERAISLLTEFQEQRCPGSVQADSRVWLVYDHAVADGVHHTLLRSPKHGLQYLATQNDRILVIDPAACPESGALLEQSSMLPPDVAPTETDAGGDVPLNPETDPLVKDCVKLFHRTSKDVCKKDFTLEVLAANRQIIDGIEVNMEVKLTSPLGIVTVHHPSCLFEVSLNHTDAAFMQRADAVQTLSSQNDVDPSGTDPTEEEKSGLKATLVMHTDLCLADEQNGLTLGLLQNRMFGELSLYKGFEHVNDGLQRLDVKIDAGTPESFDMRTQYPMCFPGTGGKEVVRDQGQCGSCWAFSSASATMNNLCVSGKGKLALASKDDRFEVSVQQIMSCNKEREGCNGGSASDVDNAFRKNGGISKERDFPYKCGGGDSLKHFEKASTACKSYPWGANCASNSAVSGWVFGGIQMVEGEEPMKTLIAQGSSLYVVFKVYKNFMKWTTGVYSRAEGSASGLHAVVAMGYGKENGVKYWILQNSWGATGWGVNGFGKFLRGTNLAGIEDRSYRIRAWVKGGTVPPCQDGKNSGYTSKGKPIPCSEAKTGRWGNLCSEETAKTNCPITCNSCASIGP